MLSADDIALLRTNYWVTVDTGTSDGVLLSIARQLGTPVPSRRGNPTIGLLQPCLPQSEGIQSFSMTYGLGSFPLHTDSAHWPLPARYIILRDIGDSHDRGTTVTNRQTFLSYFPNDTHRRALWKVSGVYGSFMCSIVNWVQRSQFIRFDPLCMRPANEAAAEAIVALKEKEIPSSVVNWTRGKTLILDNWNALHGRDAAHGDDRHSRLLQRVLVLDSNPLPLFPNVLAT